MADIRAEVIDQFDDPHVLVHWPAGATEDDIKLAAQVAWGANLPGFDNEGQPDDWRLDSCRLCRWIPSDGDYSRTLLWVNKPGPGAFWAVECWPVYATDLAVAAPAVQGEGSQP